MMDRSFAANRVSTVPIDTAPLSRAVEMLNAKCHRRGDDLVGELAFHRLVGRLLEVRTEIEPMIAGHIWRGLERARDTELRVIERGERTMARLADGLPLGSHVVAVKGNMAAMLLSSPWRRRPSRDIDLIGSVPREALASIGYSFAGNGVCHEASHYRHPSMLDLDFHHYFPVWRIDGSTIRCNALPPSELMGKSIAAGDIRIPDAAEACFVISAHLYKDFVEMPVWRRSRVRFGDLFDIDELRRHPGFSPDRYASLVEKYGGALMHETCDWLLAGVRFGSLVQRTQAMEVSRGLFVQGSVDLESLLDPRTYLKLTRSSGPRSLHFGWNAVPPHASKAPHATGGHFEAESPFRVMVERRRGMNSFYLKVVTRIPICARTAELRVTCSTGTARIKADYDYGNTASRGGGFGINVAGAFSFERALSSLLSLTLQMDSSRLGDRFLLTRSCEVGTATHDWNDYYDRSVTSAYADVHIAS